VTYVFSLPQPNPNVLTQQELSFHIFLHGIWSEMDVILLADQLDEGSLTSGWQLYPPCDTLLLSGFTDSCSCQEEEACSKIYFLFSCGQGGSVPVFNYPLVGGQKMMFGCWKHTLSEELFRLL